MASSSSSVSNGSRTDNKTPPPPAVLTECHGCGEPFPSRNAVFRHLRETNGACLCNDKDYQAFVEYVQTHNLKKTVVLYGYIPSNVVKVKCSEEDTVAEKNDAPPRIRNGDDAAKILLQAMNCSNTSKVNRSFGCNVRGTDILAQDEGTGAVCEVLACRLPQLTIPLDEWMHTVQHKLDCTLRKSDGGTGIRIFGRLDMPQAKFNAEMDVSHVRMEYLLPADFIFTGNGDDTTQERRNFFESLPDFCAQDEASSHERPSAESRKFLFKLKKLMQRFTTPVVDLDQSDPSAVMEKESHVQKRKRLRKKKKSTNSKHDEKKQEEQKNENGDKKNANGDDDQDETNGIDSYKNNEKINTNDQKNGTDESSEKKISNDKITSEKSKTTSKKKTGSRVLRRRRFHNFTPRVMAHEFLAHRRLDRFYHRATMRFDDKDRPFLALSLTGDLFLQGQALRVIGLWLALARDLIDVDIVDCVFDEEYPHLIPTPPVPSFALYAGEALYATWEGKAKLVLTPRKTDWLENGWNNMETITAVAEFQAQMHEIIAKAWMEEGVDPDGRLVAEREWTEQVLEPWAERAREQLKDYRSWKASQAVVTDAAPPEAVLPPLSSVDAAVPELFEKVLYHLREADASGLWPSTTPKRQLVMVSTSTSDCVEDTSLSAAHMRAKTNSWQERSSAYEFTEGQGGASGSFSVGAFPGEIHNQPKANALFPELMKHAFELEIALCPNRIPSSTIAINRNAQFRPHTDSGAGAGQSTSLIVGLGTYVGGELVVEGEKKDIRYKGLEFNGWTQRHWTMPFQGERYSLVWFTPKGCEGVRGVDLCKEN